MSDKRFQRFFLSPDSSREEIDAFVKNLKDLAAKQQNTAAAADEDQAEVAEPNAENCTSESDV